MVAEHYTPHSASRTLVFHDLAVEATTNQGLEGVLEFWLLLSFTATSKALSIKPARLNQLDDATISRHGKPRCDSQGTPAGT